VSRLEGDASRDPEEVERLFATYRAEGSRTARNQLVEMHAEVAEFWVRRFSHRGVPVDDLRQTALLSILRAVERFDPERGVSFATFAGRNVEGELKRYFRDRTWSVRPPRHTQELHLEIRRVQDDLVQELGRQPRVRELSERVGAAEDAVIEALAAGAAYQAASFDRPETDERAGSRGAAAVAGDDHGFRQVDRELVLRQVMGRLPPRDQVIIQMRFFEGLSQPEIAERIGVSQSYLSRVLRRILADLRARLGPAVADA
jgi:RNA polymerase sigma-B factor